MYLGQLTNRLGPNEQFREPDVYVNDQTGIFADEETALSDGSWHGLWAVNA